MEQQICRGGMCLISAAYAGVRSDRAIEYYHRPLMDFLQAYRNSGGRAVLTVHANSASWECADGLARLVDQTIEDEPEDHVRAVWSDSCWQSTYQELIRRNPTHADSYQSRYPRLIAVYLSKLRLVELAFARGDYELILWHDAGHWVSHACQHDFNQYKGMDGPGLTRGDLFDRFLWELTDRCPIVGTLSRRGRDRFHMPLSWMQQHAAKIDSLRAEALTRSLYTAVLWAFRRSSFGAYVSAFRHAWDRLIRSGHAGIEENAMTIAAWEHDVPGLNYTAWRGLLKGDFSWASVVRPGEKG